MRCRVRGGGGSGREGLAAAPSLRAFATALAVAVLASLLACSESPKKAPPIAGGDGDTGSDASEPPDPCLYDDPDDPSGDGDGDGDGVKFDVGAGEGLFEFPVSCEEVETTQTNLGCEFWAVDLPNEWRGTLMSPPAADQQFAVVVANASSLEAATVDVYLGDSSEVLVSAVVDVDATHEFALAPENIDPEANSVDGVAFRIVSDRPITAYQFNPLDNLVEVYSNDASLLMPTHALGNAYAAVTGDGVLLSTHEGDPDPAPAGAFVSVVATVDNTVVSIFPTDEILPGATEGIVLDRGQVFTVLSDASISGTNLSGTQVRADAPVAAFSGNVATVVPIEKLACCADHLEHQLIPFDAWGRAYAVAPPPSPVAVGGDDPGVVRMIGAFDDTQLEYCPSRPDGAPWSLNAEETVEFETSQPFTVRSIGDEHPFSVTAFLESNQAIAGAAGQPGDPAMIVLPAVDQFQHKYVFAVPKGYAHNFVTVVGRAGQWEFDGEPIPDADKRALGSIDGEMLWFARVVTGDGSHAVVAEVPVGIVVVGMDTAVSYGFPGGVGLDVIAPVPPVG